MQSESKRAHTGSHFRSPASGRRGISVVVVLGLIAITMAMSYGLMRSQSTTLRIQQNASRQDLARQDAMVGLSVAIHNMEQSSWGGVGTTISGTLSSHDSYSVTYTAGDSSLTSSSSNYSEYPYRLTLVSTGTSIDPNNSQSHATHKLQAVMRLIPRNTVSGPSDLATIPNYTLYQSKNDTFQFQVPVQVKGKVRVQGTVTLGSDYSWTTTISNQYLGDLNLMRLAALSDYRPFTGTLELSFNQNNSSVQSWLTGTLGVSLTNNTTTGMSSQWTFPNSVSTYRLYTGGPSYTVQTAPTTITSTLQANPVTNPLGLYYQSSDVTLGNNATIQGTLIGGSHVTISGTGVSLTPVDLLPLQGSTNKLRLPTLLSNNDLVVSSGGAPTMIGLVATFSKFDFQMCAQAKVASLQGNLVAPKIILEGRNEFDISSVWWTTLYNLFKAQLGNSPSNRISYFPIYMNNLGVLMAPSVTFLPPSNPVTYVWPTNNVTIYTAAAGDGGLRWELVSWL
ncbi:MAG TPA: hypothetical protein VFE46_14875, partial [Pirellulales bacterium]|nr:hypothetical protein [Pirellulales bacterium]